MASYFSGSLGTKEPAKLFDTKVLEDLKTTPGTEDALSDHYPVWINLIIDRYID